jgi:hypothetical protein
MKDARRNETQLDNLALLLQRIKLVLDRQAPTVAHLETDRATRIAIGEVAIGIGVIRRHAIGLLSSKDVQKMFDLQSEQQQRE